MIMYSRELDIGFGRVSDDKVVDGTLADGLTHGVSQ